MDAGLPSIPHASYADRSGVRMRWLGLGSVRDRVRILSIIAILAVACHAAEEDFKSLVQRAFELHQRGDFTQALPLLHRADQLEPQDYFVNLLLGIDTLRVGQAKTAVPFLKNAARLRPREEYPLAYLGEAYARQDMFGDAAEAYLRAVKVAPESSESSVAFVDFALARFASMSSVMRSSKRGLAAEYRLRALAMRKGDPSRQSMLQRAADLDPTAPGIWSDLALGVLQAGNLPEAGRFVHQALAADPNDQEAWVADAQLAARSSDWNRAITRINSAAQRSLETLSHAVEDWPEELQPPSSAVLSGAARKFFTCTREPRAHCDFGPPTRSLSTASPAFFREQRWEQVVKLPAPHADQTDAWRQRGIAFAHLDDCSNAIPSLERGFSTTAEDIYAMFLLSWCYSREAGQAAEQIQQSGGDEVPIHLMRGDILLRLQAKADLAVTEYQAAIDRSPNDPAILERMADAQFGAGNMDMARQNAQAALKIDPKRLAPKRTLAKIAMQNRDYGTALPYLRELVANNAQDSTMRIELAKACAQTGSLEEAWQNLAPVLESGYPDEKGSLHYLLGTVLRKMGRTAEADKAFAAATQLSEAFQQKAYRDQDQDAQP